MAADVAPRRAVALKPMTYLPAGIVTRSVYLQTSTPATPSVVTLQWHQSFIQTPSVWGNSKYWRAVDDANLGLYSQ